MRETSATATPQRVLATFLARGIVQGVGFRPFVCRAATAVGITGWVRNDGDGVTIAAEGSPAAVADFARVVVAEHPTVARIDEFRELSRAVFDQAQHSHFAIMPSLAQSELSSILVTPDLGVCTSCLAELSDPSNRRFGYPMITCTDCGPRYSFVTGMPFDRVNTTMSDFALCEACRAEYIDPMSRRYHAQSISCWSCGPRLSAMDREGNVIDCTEPLQYALERLSRGDIVAAKGLGGFHLLVDPKNASAVARLRERKRRPHRPFALLCHDISAAAAISRIDETAAQLLSGFERPIVLLEKRDPSEMVAVAPISSSWGIMLPSTPIHYLLTARELRVLIATSGNLSGQAVISDNSIAIRDLKEVADLFLVHDRAIRTSIDDSVLRLSPYSSTEVARGGSPAIPVRRARGFSPVPFRYCRALPAALALGGELKNTVCVTRRDELFVSEHIGDLADERNSGRLRDTSHHLCQLLGVTFDLVACDAHPQFQSTRYAEFLSRSRSVPLVRVQHHHAHVVSCLVENAHDGPAIGLAFDGSGYGLDGTLWGGEFLIVQGCSARRAAHFRPVGLPGGDTAVMQPFRTMLDLLWDTDPALGDAMAERTDLAGYSEHVRVLRRMFARNFNRVQASSVGRLFDAAASLIGLCHASTFEGHAPMLLEDAMGVRPALGEPLPFELSANAGRVVVDMRPAFAELARIWLLGKVHPGALSLRFHSTIISAAVQVVRGLARETGIGAVALTGGVFVNGFLSHHCRAELEKLGLRVLVHQRLPAGDGGLSLGQAAIAAEAQSRAELRSETLVPVD